MRDERDNSNYYHGGLQSGRDVYDFNRDTRDGDYGKEHQDRYRHGHNPRDFRDRRDFDANRFQTYPKLDYDMEQNYYEHTQGRGHELTNVRQRYGFPGFENSHDENDDRVRHMQRERRAQQEQEYRSGRMGGYSGSAFGGANYSTHGDFGGADRYNAMSGSGGNAEHLPSASGYGSGHSNNSMHPDRSTHTDRGEPNYFHQDRNPRERRYFEGNNRHQDEYGRRTDRGGYSDYDPNY